MNKTLRFLGSILFIHTLVLGQGTSGEKPLVPRGKSFILRVENEKNQSSAKATSDLRQMLSLKKEETLQLISEREGASGMRHQKYKQYVRGIPVEYGSVSTLARQGVLQSLSGELYDIPDDLSPVPSISETTALDAALNFVHARKEIDKPDPVAELVYVRVYVPSGSKKKNGMALAYKFDIYQRELPARDYIFVDAHQGTVVHRDPILKHAEPAQAATRYSGTRTITTTRNAVLNAYVLNDDARGLGIETYNMNHGFSYENTTPFTDADNQWTAQEFDNANKDNVALDAHWGAMVTYDYFKGEHGRNSYDDRGAKIKSYVHFGNNFPNAFWDGNVMTYGDGDVQMGPLTALDICGHEIAHAVCTSTANLVYRDESGALNEGLSDIWGATIEHHAAPEKNVWDLGQDIGFIFRSLSDPNAHRQPDTYGGDYWYTGLDDDGGVHINSGVLNHWYYLLVMGQSGTNDHGTDYEVQGIGFESAARIVYETEAHHLTPNSAYSDARLASLQAATDLFGAQSNEYQQTLRAWDAAGVYDADFVPPLQLEAHATSTDAIALSWADNISNEASFIIERSPHFNRGFTPVKTTGENEITYRDEGLAKGIYYYRIKTMLPDGRSSRPSAVVSVALNVAPLIMTESEATVCDRIFLDPGGLDAYEDHQNITMVIRPDEPGKKVHVSFSSFELSGFAFEGDRLEIFDGADIQDAKLVGTLTGTSLPGDINATTASGALTFHFISRTTTGFGWQAQLSCVSIPEAPVNLTATAVSGSQVNLTWEDRAMTETGYRVERGILPVAPFREVAVLPANTTHYEHEGLSMDNAFTYRVVALEGAVYSAYSNTATAVIGRNPLLMKPGTLSTCSDVFLDPAGGLGYPDAMAFVMTLTPSIPGTKLAITFSEFDLGENFIDGLSIFDGPAVKQFKRQGAPPRIISSANDGSLKFEFVSGFGGGHGAGWRAEITCLTNPDAPTDLLATAAGSDRVHLTWVDHADDETGYIIERATGGLYSRIVVLGADAQTYDDTGLQLHINYTYRVWATIEQELFSAPSNESSVMLDRIVDPPVAVETDPDLLKVRPNPASETIYITSDVYSIRRLSLIDVLGRTSLQAAPAQADYALDVRTLGPGIYTLLIQIGNNISTTRRIQIKR